MRTKTILIVDDDEDYLTQHKILLEQAGYAVVTAGGQAEAEDLLKDVSPDLAIVDLMMEDMDGGFALCHRLKRAFPGMPVILATAVTSETGLTFDTATAEERSWVKADAMLSKPFRFEQLTREITRLLET